MASKIALEMKRSEVEKNNLILQQRRDFVINELDKIGIKVKAPKATFYIWFSIPESKDSLFFVKRLLLKTGVITFPGIGYGTNGEGYIRIALVQDFSKIKEAFQRITPYLRQIFCLKN